MPETEGALAAGQPHLAIVLLWYPLFTQPFIFREVESLAARMPLEVYTLYGRNLRHCSGEMKMAAGRCHAYGSAKVGQICWEALCQVIRQPRVIWKLFRRSLWRKWTSLEVFGENLWAFLTGISLGRRFREDGIDLVYAPWPRGAATAAWVGATLAGLPFAIAARGDNLEPADPDLADKLAAAVLVRANNEADRKRIELFDCGQAKGKTALVYNSLTLPGPKRREAGMHSPLRLLSLGRFDVTKGFDVLLQACAILKRQGLDFRLTLAGGGGKVMGLGAMTGTLKEMRRGLGLEGDVEMPGLISHDDLPDLLASHDIFLAPCVIDSSGRRDGIPNTVIEALAAGMPVIASDINALPEVVRNGETGVLVPQKDPAALARAIADLSERPDEAAKLGKNGARLAAELFDAEANAARLAEMLGKAASREGTGCAG
ncbi:MAG: glycosyltransferase family 4 protein [Desulfovibrio sp.]|nr:glycosyltransferase family 4 protein [Desulfovibrio sp.]